MIRIRSIWIDGIGPVLDYKAVSMAHDVEEAMSEGADEMQAYAQDNASWDDQTGAAREGLTAEVGVEDGDIVINLFHTVDYGIWLETIQSGQYAIILPTIEALGPGIIRRAGGKVTEL